MEYKPHNYQAYCIQRIVDEPAIGLFLQPSLGKTSITLSAINILRYFRWCVRKPLVIAPKKVAEGTWSKEAAKWDHLKHLRISVVLGTRAQRIKALNTPADMYIINRENTLWLVKYYQQAWPFDMLIIDESTSFKNSNSKRFKAIKLVRRFIKKVVILTGTPSPKGLEDLWAQVYLLDEGARLGKTLTQFRQMFFDETIEYHAQGKTHRKYNARSDAEDAILKAIGDICISMKTEDYLELPPVIEDEFPVILDEKALKAYKQFEKELLLTVDESTITAKSAAVLAGKLLQFCSGAIYDDNKNVILIHNCKIEAYMEMLESIGDERCLTFYGYQHDKDRIIEALKGTGKRVRVYKDTNDEDAWNAGEIDVLLAHPASCGHGLNLQQGGQHIIWFTPSWNFEFNDQGLRRLLRQGSPYDKIYNHFLIVQGGIDEDVLERVRERASDNETIMSVLKARIKKIKEAAV